jgi:deazaflavin-dependent oxidoreductase (nitroreductase family)
MARPRTRTMAGLNKIVLAVLHTPLRFLLDPGICQLSYAGRKTGKPVRLPVIYARDEATVAVLVGDARHKTWWRNFRSPRPVELRIKAATLHGTAVLARAGSDDYTRALNVYTRRFTDMSAEPGDRLLIIRLQP